MNVNEIACPSCGAPLTVADIVQGNGMATCSYCGHTFDARPLLEKPENVEPPYLAARRRLMAKRRRQLLVAAWVVAFLLLGSWLLNPFWVIFKTEDNIWRRPVFVAQVIATGIAWVTAFGRTADFVRRRRGESTPFNDWDAN